MLASGEPGQDLLLVDVRGIGTGSEPRPHRPPLASPAAGWLARQLLQTAGERLNKTALVTERGEWTFDDLQFVALRVAAAISSEPGYQVGDRVVLLMSNSPEYIAAFYGVLLAGGVVVPVYPRTEQAALRAILQSTDAPIIITDSQTKGTYAEFETFTTKRLRLSGRDDDAPRTAPHFTIAGAPPDDAQALAAIFFTAGSTGSPKGVMLSHENLFANARAIQNYLRITEADRPLCVLPLQHAFGNSVLHSHLLAGASLVIDGQPAFPESIIAALARHACTSLSGVPDLLRRLLERSSLGRTSLPSLRYMAVAGGALPYELSLEVARRIAPAEFFVMYGQTEATARLAFVPPERLAEVPAGAIGQAIPGVTLQVVDEQGVPVPDGTVGELRARGPNVMLGYWRDAEATRERLRDGWLMTGDLAAIEAGIVVLKGRRNSLVKIAGFRVHPADLEEFAMRRLPVAEAVAVAFETAAGEMRLALYLRTGGSGSELPRSQVAACCRAELPAHLVPDIIQVVDALPLNDALKIDRLQLTRLAAEESRSTRRP